MVAAVIGLLPLPRLCPVLLLAGFLRRAADDAARAAGGAASRIRPFAGVLMGAVARVKRDGRQQDCACPKEPEHSVSTCLRPVQFLQLSCF